MEAHSARSSRPSVLFSGHGSFIRGERTLGPRNGLDDFEKIKSLAPTENRNPNRPARRLITKSLRAVKREMETMPNN